MTKFSERLRQLRTARDMSQMDFAKIIGMSKSSINMYERGEREPGLETLEKIADFFNVDMDTLLARSNVESHIISFPNDTGELSDAAQVLFQTLKGATEEEILQAVKIIEALKKNV